jgi:hypothetical protein
LNHGFQILELFGDIVNSLSQEQIKQARTDADLTQSQAAALIYSKPRTWQLGNLATWQLGNLATWQLGNLATWQLGNLATWESGDSPMHPGLFELFTLKIAMSDLTKNRGKNDVGRSTKRTSDLSTFS